MNREERRTAGKHDGTADHAALPPPAIPHPDPSSADLCAKALLYHQAGRLTEAEALYRHVLTIDPKHADSLHLLGLIASQTGHGGIAVDLIEQAIALDSRVPIFHYNLGIVLQAQGRLAEAAERFQLATAFKPDFAEAHYNLGNVLQARGGLADAVESYRQALALKPDYAEAYTNLGNAFQALGKLAEAVESCRRALALKPEFGEAYSKLGNALQGQGKLTEAEESYRRALALEPDYVEAHNNLGVVLQAQGRFAEAVESYGRALAAYPDYAEAHYNLGIALRAQGRLAEAVERNRRALTLKPDYAAAHNHLGMVLLLLGQFDEGWREHEWRLKLSPPLVQSFSQPLWDGADLAGRTLLLHAEQGYGDAIQFCRFAPLLGQHARIILEVRRPLIGLLSGLPDIAEIVARGDELPPFDVHCPLLSIPRILGTRLETIPNKIPYLHADPERAAFWRRRLDALAGLRVGLVWAGSAAIPSEDRYRSISLDALASLGSIQGALFVSLQKLQDGREKPAPCEGLTLHDWTDDLHDFAETAALIEGLDLVITVDTSVAHLAGALGKPVWLLNRFNTCWRWLLDRDDSPWYPTMRIFRQPRLGDWPSVIRDVRQALQIQVDASHPPRKRISLG